MYLEKIGPEKEVSAPYSPSFAKKGTTFLHRIYVHIVFSGFHLIYAFVCLFCYVPDVGKAIINHPQDHFLVLVCYSINSPFVWLVYELALLKPQY